jgi:histidine phosphotransferase ChpT
MGNDMAADLRIAELMVSRLCHELAGPLGAVGNGLELLSMEGPDNNSGAVDLTSRSARRATDLLQFYRIAYGRSGAERQDDPSHLRDLAVAALAHDRVALDWPDDMLVPAGSGRLILNMTAVAAEALPRGGTVRVRAGHGGGLESAPRISVSGEGDKLLLSEDLRAALHLEATVAALTARNVHAFLTQALARQMEGELAVDHGPDRLTLSVAIR